MHRRLWQMKLLFFVPALVLLSGCPNSGPANSTVSGSVSYQGKPVTGGLLTLTFPDKKVERIDVKPDGTFNVAGTPRGLAKVTIDTAMLQGRAKPTGAAKGSPPPKGFEPPPPAVYVHIPAKYADVNTTPLTWDIKAPDEKKDFALTD